MVAEVHRSYHVPAYGSGAAGAVAVGAVHSPRADEGVAKSFGRGQRDNDELQVEEAGSGFEPRPLLVALGGVPA